MRTRRARKPPGFPKSWDFLPLPTCSSPSTFKTLIFLPILQNQTQQGLLPNENLGARNVGGFFFPRNSHYQIICFTVYNGAFCAPSPADQSTRQMSDCPPVSMYIIITPSELLQNSTGVNKNRIWPYIYFKLAFIGENGRFSENEPHLHITEHAMSTRGCLGDAAASRNRAGS